MKTTPSRDSEISRRVVGRLRARGGWGTGLRLTPMIDVIFLLLVFFLATAKFRPNEDFLPIKLPAAAAGTTLSPVEPLRILVNQDEKGCAVTIGFEKQVILADSAGSQDLATLAEAVRDVFESHKRTAADPVDLICSEGVKWDHFMKIYNLLFSMGITDITIPITE